MSPFSANCFTVLFSDHASCPSWLDQLWLARSGDGSLRRMIVLPYTVAAVSCSSAAIIPLSCMLMAAFLLEPAFHSRT